MIRATPGQTIYTPPGEEHWHGAAPDRFMEHLALLENGDDPATTTTWLEHVDDADYTRAHESDGIIRLTCTSADGQLMVVEARRLIKASGFGVVPDDPLGISSARVVSVSPDFCDMRGDEMRASEPRCGSWVAERPRWIPLTH